MPRPLIVWGARGHAKVILEALSADEFEAIAFFDNDPAAVSPICQIPIHHGWESFQRWCANRDRANDVFSVVAIGGDRGTDRVAIQRKLMAQGFPPITVIHATAFVARSAKLGLGCQILAQAAVCVEAVLGESCIVNTRASVDHESVLGDGVHVAPGATITGCVTIGDGSFVGAGATVLPRIQIGRNVIVGAGAVVTRDIPDNQVVVGNPARCLSESRPSRDRS